MVGSTHYLLKSLRWWWNQEDCCPVSPDPGWEQRHPQSLGLQCPEIYQNTSHAHKECITVHTDAHWCIILYTCVSHVPHKLHNNSM